MTHSVWPIIRNCLGYSRQHLVDSEFACLCVIRASIFTTSCPRRISGSRPSSTLSLSRPLSTCFSFLPAPLHESIDCSSHVHAVAVCVGPDCLGAGPEISPFRPFPTTQHSQPLTFCLRCSFVSSCPPSPADLVSRFLDSFRSHRPLYQPYNPARSHSRELASKDLPGFSFIIASPFHISFT
jgi:hypothetical protein